MEDAKVQYLGIKLFELFRMKNQLDNNNSNTVSHEVTSIPPKNVKYNCHAILVMMKHQVHCAHGFLHSTYLLTLLSCG